MQIIAKLELPVLLRFGNVIAEFFLDARTLPHIYFYTLTQRPEPEILQWGQEYSEHAAHVSARMAAHDLISHREDLAVRLPVFSTA
ncbi:MAG: hypothetical protein ABIP12_07535 [Terriglobales bacterium]